MTELTEVEEVVQSSSAGKQEGAAGASDVKLRNDILDFLSRKNEIHFKSQQIDDPELTYDEKRLIASEILNQDPGKFLFRFGKYLLNEHLCYFDSSIQKDMQITDVEEQESKDFEIKYLIKDLRKNLRHKHKIIKNRRYTAMQSLIKENNYFSEKEMMQREPHLYEQLVGQYLTEAEKRVRDGFDVKNTPFSKILLNNIDKERMYELRKKQENEDTVSDDTISDKSSTIDQEVENEDLYPKIPRSFKNHWGDFEDEPKRNFSKQKIKKDQQKYITAGEREMLRQEFVGIMYSKFLEGEDKDFDYSEIDDNTELDNLKQMERDEEDEYFDGSEDENFIGWKMDTDEVESDDELDTYMKHLN